MPEVVRYRSPDEDSARWAGFPFRDGDIVISTRSKSGTTWLQMICALLVFQTPRLPDSLGNLSPWLDWLVAPRDQVVAHLEQQRHRRFIKTHTPLDGLPLDPRAAFVVVARHPLDIAVSLYHHSRNIDRTRLQELTGRVHAADDRAPRLPLHEWLVGWIEWQGSPSQELDSLPGVLWHFSDAWSRRSMHNVHLVHYADLSTNLEESMRALATQLDFDVPDDRWPDIVGAASFERMRARADVLIDPVGVLKDRTGFFRRGITGEAREHLSAEELARYHVRAETLAPPDLLAWLHRRPPRLLQSSTPGGAVTPSRVEHR
ncbi:MAG TPA: sulfotransferase domain-containing protein [Acidimicrobiales bacterium]|nr:sulfotransferase domain-containing protein [Acidimicrobiales bacterium]